MKLTILMQGKEDWDNRERKT